MFDETMRAEITAVAAETGLPAAALAAVAEIESGLRVQTIVNGRPEPLIRFEGHYFDSRLTGERRTEARRQGLANPKAGAIANPASQAARWKLLARASAIDREAAYESVSWGIGQVMGAHWAWLGYASVDSLVAEARSGANGQLRLMARYIVKAGLAPALSEGRWTAFARGYNGPGYRRNAYDTKLAKAHARYADMFDEAPAAPRTLSIGSTGSDVRKLQEQLRAMGYELAVDGRFGPEMQRAVIAYQTVTGLKIDGIAGILTRQAIDRFDLRRTNDAADNEPAPFWASGLIGRLFKFLI